LGGSNQCRRIKPKSPNSLVPLKLTPHAYLTGGVYPNELGFVTSPFLRAIEIAWTSYGYLPGGVYPNELGFLTSPF